jgi:hypothetical protein
VKKLFMKKKSQAALEFLTTYAWALILIIILIATIAYFGILRPQQILPDRCVFNVGFGCEAFLIDNSATPNTFVLNLKNQVGEAIEVTGITLKSEDETTFTCTGNPTYPIDQWRIGQVQTLTWTTCSFPGTIITGDKGKIIVSVDYFPEKAGSTFAKTAEGEVLTSVQ